MSDRTKTVLLIVFLTLLVSSIGFVVGLVILHISIEGSIISSLIGAGAFLYLIFREEEAPPLVMRQSTWQTPEDTLEKDEN